MKSDLDRLMEERALDAIVVEGPDGLSAANAPWSYMVNGQHLNGTVVKRRGVPAKLLFNPMERQQAEATGLELVSIGAWDRREIAAKFPSRLDSRVELYRRIFNDLGLRGRVGIYGTVEASAFLALSGRLQEVVPGLELIGEVDRNLILEARQTKDAAEIARMAEVGRQTAGVVGAVVDFIRRQRASGDGVVDEQGEAVTIGDVKALMRREFDARRLEAPNGVIFAQGRDAGIPHAAGDDAAQLRTGQPIVFDIFPREAGGYYHDMTRTFAIDHAPPELQQVYDDVRSTFDQLVSELEVGAPMKRYQDRACELFSARGHRTIAEEYPLEEGYVHALGHGVGLDVHEDPNFPPFADLGETLMPGAVFTVEPGLYYPGRGIGVRLEDTFVCDLDGSFRSLSPFPLDLVIPVHGA